MIRYRKEPEQEWQCEEDLISAKHSLRPKCGHKDPRLSTAAFSRATNRILRGPRAPPVARLHR